jgi:hypothetical protein
LLSVHSRYGLHACKVAFTTLFHRRLQQLCYLHRCSDCYRAERTSSRVGLAPTVDQTPFTAHADHLINSETEARAGSGRTALIDGGLHVVSRRLTLTAFSRRFRGLRTATFSGTPSPVKSRLGTGLLMRASSPSPTSKGLLSDERGVSGCRCSSRTRIPTAWQRSAISPTGMLR